MCWQRAHCVPLGGLSQCKTDLWPPGTALEWLDSETCGDLLILINSLLVWWWHAPRIATALMEIRTNSDIPPTRQPPDGLILVCVWWGRGESWLTRGLLDQLHLPHLCMYLFIPFLYSLVISDRFAGSVVVRVTGLCGCDCERTRVSF